MMEDQKSHREQRRHHALGRLPLQAQPKEAWPARVYGKKDISERHRHRFEFNNAYLDAYQKAGMVATGINPQGKLVEIVEVKDHPWFVGVQFHPEYRSTVAKPHPLFIHFVACCHHGGHAKARSGAESVKEKAKA